MCMGFMMSGRLKNIHLSHQCPFLVPVWVRWLLESWKRIDKITAGMIPVWVGQCVLRFGIFIIRTEYCRIISTVETVIVSLYKTSCKTNCCNYRGIYSPHVNFTNPVSRILLPRVTPYLDKITVDHLCGFRGDRSSADGVYFIRLRLPEKNV